METVVCDLCGLAESVPVAYQTDKLHCTTDKVFAIVSCSGCGLHYTNPRPSVGEIGEYYAKSYAFHSAPSKFHRLLRTVVAKIANGPFTAAVDLVPSIGRRFVPSVKPKISDPVRTYYASGGKGLC